MRPPRLQVGGWLCATGLTEYGHWYLQWHLGITIGMRKYAPTGFIEEPSDGAPP